MIVSVRYCYLKFKMEVIVEEERKNMLWRIPLVVAILVAIFWGIWYLIAGEIPAVNQIKWSEDITTQLPFAISRLWDILFVFIWAFILVCFFTQEKIKKNKNLSTRLIAGLSLGLVVGLTISLSIGLVASLIVGLAFGLIAVGDDLAIALSLGLGTGLIVGLSISMGTALIVGPAVGLVVGIKFLFSAKFKDWLMGK